MNIEDWSPLAIELMLFCYATTTPEQHVSWGSLAGLACRDDLSTLGLIDENNRATPMGIAWVKMILSTPLPLQAWIDPRTNAPVNNG